MDEIKVTVVHPTDGRQLSIIIEDDMTGLEFLENLLENEFMQANGDSGYVLGIKGGAEIGENETLRSAGVKDNETLMVIPATNAGIK